MKVKIILRRKQLSNGEFPIILRITKGGVKIISTGISCKEENWNGFELTRHHPNHVIENRMLAKYKEDALEIIDKYRLTRIPLTLEKFISEFKSIDNQEDHLFNYWDERILDLTKSGQIGNSRVYIDTKKSFKAFIKNDTIQFSQITIRTIDKYEVYLRENDNTNSGISVKMRTFRALWNRAIRDGIIKKDNYPFGKYNFSRLKTKSVKTRLTLEQIKLIENMDLRNFPHLINARNWFIFSYYSRGMNFKDLMLLKWENVKDNKLFYTRAKTNKNFVIDIIKPLKDILTYYQDSNPNCSYVFPILTKDKLTPIQTRNRKVKILAKYNRDLKLIAEILGIKENITSYSARHSFATNLKFKGVSTDIISQLLGHSDLQVTQTYLSEFGDEVLDDSVRKLLEPLGSYHQVAV